MNFNLCYIPVGVPTFELNSARKLFEESKTMLKSITDNVTVPDDILLSIDDLKKYLDTLHPDCLVFQNNTFANSAYIAEVVRKFHCPILLWTLSEPIVDGGRLRLNSLTGAFSAGNEMMMNGVPFDYVLGTPEKAYKKVLAFAKAAEVKLQMSQMTLAQVGHTPQGFGFGRGVDSELSKYFGINLLSVEAREIIEKAKNITDDDAKEYLNIANKRIKNLDDINSENVVSFAKLYKAYSDFVCDNNIGALASRCWPDFFTSYGTPVCSVLAMLNDDGVAASCEADVYGALSMYIGMKFSGMPVFFGDPVSVDETDNTLTFWHCGTAATSIADESCGACSGVHCNRKIGPTLEFNCKSAEDVTVFRIGRKPNGEPRIIIFYGSAPNIPKRFSGTSIAVKTDAPVKSLVESIVIGGWEPHYAVIYGDCRDSIESLGKMLGIEVVTAK